MSGPVIGLRCWGKKHVSPKSKSKAKALFQNATPHCRHFLKHAVVGWEVAVLDTRYIHCIFPNDFSENVAWLLYVYRVSDSTVTSISLGITFMLTGTDLNGWRRIFSCPGLVGTTSSATVAVLVRSLARAHVRCISKTLQSSKHWLRAWSHRLFTHVRTELRSGVGLKLCPRSCIVKVSWCLRPRGSDTEILAINRRAI